MTRLVGRLGLAKYVCWVIVLVYACQFAYEQREEEAQVEWGRGNGSAWPARPGERGRERVPKCETHHESAFWCVCLCVCVLFQLHPFLLFASHLRMYLYRRLIPGIRNSIGMLDTGSVERGCMGLYAVKQINTYLR